MIPSNSISLGAGVAEALAKSIGVNGAPQLQGDPMTPSSIIVPDMTSIVSQTGSIGLNNGKLALADGANIGGRVVAPSAPARYSATNVWTFGTQSKASAFVKLFSIPITAADFAIGKNFTLQGRVIIGGPNDSSGISNITNMPFGVSFLGGSTALWNGASSGQGDSQWNAKNLTNFTSVMGSAPIIIDIIAPAFSGRGNSLGFVAANTASKLRITNPIEYLITAPGVAPVFYKTSSLGFSEITAVAGFANELCLMLQINTSNAGNYANEKFSVAYDIVFDFKN